MPKVRTIVWFLLFLHHFLKSSVIFCILSPQWPQISTATSYAGGKISFKTNSFSKTNNNNNKKTKNKKNHEIMEILEPFQSHKPYVIGLIVTYITHLNIFSCDFWKTRSNNYRNKGLERDFYPKDLTLQFIFSEILTFPISIFFHNLLCIIYYHYNF